MAEPTLLSPSESDGFKLHHGDSDLEPKIESFSKWPTRVVPQLSFSHLKTEEDKKKTLKAITYVVRGISVYVCGPSVHCTLLHHKDYY
jgi:hypothetical protein